MATYFLSPQVHFCLTDDHVVLLDLRHDRYMALGRAEAAALSSVVPQLDCAVRSSTTLPPADANDTSQLLDALVEENILTTYAQHSRVQNAVSIPLPSITLVDSGRLDALLDTAVTSKPRIRFRDAWNLLAAYASAASRLRWGKIDRTVHHVQARKDKARQRSEKGIDIRHARELVALYLRMRPLVTTSHDKCLQDALMLIEFLARYGVYPSWIFGVRTGPFEAHCWVQHGNAVFNDTVEHASGYVPIMAV